MFDKMVRVCKPGSVVPGEVCAGAQVYMEVAGFWSIMHRIGILFIIPVLIHKDILYGIYGKCWSKRNNLNLSDVLFITMCMSLRGNMIYIYIYIFANLYYGKCIFAHFGCLFS